MLASIALGTAQFGQDYGVSNLRGRVREDEVAKILSLAAENRMTSIDTSPSYGDVERTLGRCWPFPSPFKPTIRPVAIDRGLSFMEQRLRRSINHMGLTRADTVLVHHTDDLLGADGDALWSRLLALKDEGLVRRVGIACTRKDPARLLARRFKPDVVQLPVSLFDQGFIKDGTIGSLCDDGIEIHAHSLFLQGLIFLARHDLPVSLEPYGAVLSKLRRTMLEAGIDPLHCALSFARSVSGIKEVVVGVTSAAELRAILAVANRPCPSLDWSLFELHDQNLLDPQGWSRLKTSTPNAPPTSDPIIIMPRNFAHCA